MATRAEWEERIDRLERSGLDAAEFARREGVPPAQLERWYRQLRAP
jgi:transposase-like protein